MASEELVEEGIVIESLNGIAEVALIKSDNCEECSAKLFCKPKSDSTSILKANDPYGLRPGDEVRIAVKGNIVLKVSALLYGIPLVLFVTGLLFGMELFAASGFRELYSFFLSTGLTGLYFLVLFKSAKIKNQRLYLPDIIFVKRKNLAHI